MSNSFFFKFITLHSILIGLFPFFLPVYLWNTGFSLAEISAVIALTGFGFMGALWTWERVRLWCTFSGVMIFSLCLEVLLLSIILTLNFPGSLVLLGLINGLYNGFFWTTQRVLFLESLTRKTTGKQFGNLQIIVFLALKLGILMGAFLIDLGGFWYIYGLSVLGAIVGSIGIFMAQNTLKWPQSLQAQKPLKITEITNFKDTQHSRFMFWIDGPLLFCESYFWILTLFMISHESFLVLGYWVIGLAFLFSLTFWFIKQKIDQIPVQKIYLMSIIGYTLTWVLRATVEPTLSLTVIFWLLLAITFGTSFFRLTFNKRFFDNTQREGQHRYLFLKSYYSQFSIFLFFGILSIYFSFYPGVIQDLSNIYWPGAVLSLGYIFYGKNLKK